MLAGELERRPARRQHAEVGTGAEQLGNEWRGVEEVFEAAFDRRRTDGRRRAPAQERQAARAV